VRDEIERALSQRAGRGNPNLCKLGTGLYFAGHPENEQVRRWTIGPVQSGLTSSIHGWDVSPMIPPMDGELSKDKMN